MNIIKPIKAILIDLDGTLADSAPDLTTALNMSLEQIGRSAQPLELTRQWIGNGLDQLLHRALTNDFNGQAETELLNQVKELFFQAYAEVNGNESRLFPGVLAALNRFKKDGIKLACVTNKGHSFSIQLLEKLQILDLFDYVIGGDDVVNKKPAPDSILNTMNHFAVSANECLMLGDSDNDVYAANRAGVDVLCVDYGYSQGVDLSALSIAGMISSMDDIQLTP